MSRGVSRLLTLGGPKSSGIRCARTFCEHLTALYAVECSQNPHGILRDGTGSATQGGNGLSGIHEAA